jgi:hypothetical protein
VTIIKTSFRKGPVTTTVICGEHGEQPRTYVCDHIVQTLRDRRPRGFFFDADSDQEYPDAWCGQCDEMLHAAGGEWTEELGTTAHVRLLCARCYLTAKAINGL